MRAREPQRILPVIDPAELRTGEHRRDEQEAGKHQPHAEENTAEELDVTEKPRKLDTHG